ncbi:MAG: hypothetical protein HOW73_07630 [Polyangiaceae bacterium]|nr:hypothetical protein [Polyangiaceae bacterium]
MSFKVASFNLKDFFDPRTDGERPIVEDKIANVGSLLRQADADVVALQEIGSSSLLDRLLTEHLGDLGYSHAHVGPVDRRGIGNAIVSRIPVVRRDIIVADRLPFPRFAFADAPPFPNVPLRRAVVHLTVDAGDLGEVDVLTIHFKSRLGAPMKDDQGEPILDASPTGVAEAHIRAWILRSSEALHLRSTVDALLDADPKRRVVVLGDFNDSLDAIPTRIVRGAFQYVEPARALRSCADLVPSERRFSILHAGARDLIDHIFVSSALAEHLRGCTILNETLRDHGPYVPDGPIAPDSDHAPVVAWFE